MARLDTKLLLETLALRFQNDRITKLQLLPHPHAMPNAKKAADIVKEAIQANEQITIVGDYDVDGVTSAVILHDFLTAHGAQVCVVIPSRFEDGYGLGVGVLEKISSSVIITVDNGITAHEAANRCAQKNIKLIVVDHHTIGETLPNASAIVHPSLDDGFCDTEICAAAVTWYFIAALKIALVSKIDLKAYLDLVAIATIADVMPLRDINRTFVKVGIELLEKTNRPAIAAIRQILRTTSFTSSDIAYKISPRLNSAGRLSNAREAFDFLASDNEQTASKTFARLDALNEERKKIESALTIEATSLANEHADIIVVSGYGWHEGVLGIVASRLVQRFKKPAIVLTKNELSAKGSARSYNDIDIFHCISQAKHLLTTFGGHKMAAGMTLRVQDIDEFSVVVNNAAIDCRQTNEPLSQPDEVSFADISHDFYAQLALFEPFGEGNERPLFTSSHITITHVKPIGKNGFKLTLIDETCNVEQTGIVFRVDTPPQPKDIVNLSFFLQKSTFYPYNIELRIESITPSTK